jgi:hypothetical protein
MIWFGRVKRPWHLWAAAQACLSSAISKAEWPLPMAPDITLLDHVPIGEENAASGRAIWKSYGVWSPMGIRGKLNTMVAEGLIYRRMVSNNRASETCLYFRMPSP